MTKRDVFIVMCNDFPDGVFETEEGAESYIASEKSKLQREKDRYGGRMHVPNRYYKLYSFPLRSE